MEASKPEDLQSTVHYYMCHMSTGWKQFSTLFIICNVIAIVFFFFLHVILYVINYIIIFFSLSVCLSQCAVHQYSIVYVIWISV